MRQFTVLLSLLLAITACKKSSDSSSTLTLEQIITQGTWKVSYYTENGTDKTAAYNGSTLQFQGGGTLKVVKAGTSFAGSWNINATFQTLGINISSFDLVLLALNNDWKVTAVSETNVQMKDDGSQKVLHIQRL
jgi:hypothetical protein